MKVTKKSAGNKNKTSVNGTITSAFCNTNAVIPDFNAVIHHENTQGTKLFYFMQRRKERREFFINRLFR